MTKPTEYQLRQLAAWISSHGLWSPVRIVDNAVRFTDHDGQHHQVTTMRAAREALGY